MRSVCTTAFTPTSWPIGEREAFPSQGEATPITPPAMPPTPATGDKCVKCLKLDPELRPVCCPISSLEDALAVDTEREKQWLQCDVPLSRRWAAEADHECKVLVCHDMKGGYLEDRFVQGSEVMDSYRFWHWQHADVWVYFSHHFLTIPPPAWTAAAHHHGVKVLGTLITEHEEGSNICCSFLQSKETYQRLADKMVSLARDLGFEGWLVNIENKIEPDQISNLQEFLKYLVDMSHKDNADSLVYWYDSVITSGELKWQDELNDLNKPFFEVSDGLFTNYVWNKEKLQRSKAEERQMGRSGQVLVGVDVFGRGTDWGGFNTRLALSLIKEHNLSIAMFAPGWVYEVEGKENFTANNNRFWKELHDLLPTRKVTELPLSTSFCQGFGEAYFCCGEKVLDRPWSDLGLQQLQPNSTASLRAARGTEPGEQQPADEHGTSAEAVPPPPASLYTQDAYLGGGCLSLETSGAGHSNYCPLFQTDVKVASDLFVSVTFKLLPGPQSCSAWLALKLARESQEEMTVHCCLSGGSHMPDCDRCPAFTELEEAVPRYLPFKHENKNGWMTKYFLGDQALTGGWTVKEVGLGVRSSSTPGTAQTLLGHLLVQEAPANVDSFLESPQPQGLVCRTVPARDLHLEVESGSEAASSRDRQVACLQWRSPCRGQAAYFNVYRLQQQGGVVCLGHTLHSWFLLPGEQVASEVAGAEGDVQVTVQPVLAAGLPVPLSRCASVKLPSSSV